MATHFLSGGGATGNGQGRHYMPIARDYSSLNYSSSGVSVSSGAASTASYHCSTGQQQQQQQQQQSVALERPASVRNSHTTDTAAGQTGSRLSSASASPGEVVAVGGGGSNVVGQVANPLLSPCSAMEEASSPGSATSQLSYLGALQSPAASSLAPLGFPNPYSLLGKDGAGLAAAAAAAAAAHAAQAVGHHVTGHHHLHPHHHHHHGATTAAVSGNGGNIIGGSSGNGGPVSGTTGGHKKKEPKPGSDVRSFGCQVTYTCWCDHS